MSHSISLALPTEVASGTLLAWLRRPGDSVRRGDPVAVVEADNGVVEILHAGRSGVIEALAVQGGEGVDAGNDLWRLRPTRVGGR